MVDWKTVVGEKSDSTVVLLHPAGGTRHAWTPHADRLADDYRVVTLDLPAHGIHPEADFTFDRAVDDIGDVLDEEGSAVLVGHSMGGYVAIRAAAEHADQVDGLLIAGAAYNWHSPKGLALSTLQYGLSYVYQAMSYSDWLTEWFKRKYAPDNDAQFPPTDEDTYDNLHGVVSSIRAGVFQETWPAVEAYDGPVLIVHGDSEAFAEHAGKLAARIKANLRWLDGGHNAPMHDIDAFTNEIERFLGDLHDDLEVISDADD